MNSAIYRGWVRHRRFQPRDHAFTYRMLMLLLDLDELEHLGNRIRLFSTSGRKPVQFRRSDHWGDPATPLKQCVLDLVEMRTGLRPAGPVRLLTQPRFWGVGFNPLSVYYCHGADGEVVATVAEVTNIPWGERCCYVLPNASGQRTLCATFDKAMHVSPFMPMDQHYCWRSRRPGKTLAIHLESRTGNATTLDATLSLRRQALTNRNIAACLLAYPFSTARVVAAIHWEALKLFAKGTPYYPRPANRQSVCVRPDTVSIDPNPTAVYGRPDLSTKVGALRSSAETSSNLEAQQ